MKNQKPSRPTKDAQPGSLHPAGSATGDELIIAFVQGAQSWEYEKTRATMWPSDRNMMEKIATERLLNGTLGKSPNSDSGASCGLSRLSCWRCISDFQACQQGFIDFLGMNIGPGKATMGRFLPNPKLKLRERSRVVTRFKHFQQIDLWL